MKLYYLPAGLCCLIFIDAVICQNVAIRRLHIRSDIAFRFATTLIQSDLINNGNTAAEATFRVTLPKSAFISNFSMRANGKTIYGEVKEKGIAITKYEEAKVQGLSASHIASIRDTNLFKVSVNVAATQKVIFNLTYQEVLQRRLELVEHVINIDPAQVVSDLKIEVHINESRPLTKLIVPDITKEGKEVPGSKDIVISRCSSTSAEIVYTPTGDQQKSLSEAGIIGQFLVQYDVERGLDTGEVKMTNGYFVHVFAPDGLPPLAKNVLFLLDKSGSMRGLKEKQLKKAMFAILDDLRYDDMFNIITFSTSVDMWSNTLMKVNKANIQKARLHVTAIKPSGWTDINAALLRTVTFLNTNVIKADKGSTIVIFLTDGLPTSGVRDLGTILFNVQNTNKGKYTICTLGFGNNVNFDFIKKLALQNGGSPQRIYEYLDAAKQIETFYDEISISVLNNLSINYIKPDAKVLQVTKNHFQQFFQGDEILVAGRLSNSATTQIEVCMTGQMRQRNIHYCSSYRVQPWIPKTGSTAFIERMWAYLTIQDLLEKALVEKLLNIQASIRQHALDLSLKMDHDTTCTRAKYYAQEKNSINMAPGKMPLATVLLCLSMLVQ